MHKRKHIFWGCWIDRQHIVHNMEGFQDLIVVLLCLGLLCVMVIQLYTMFRSLLSPDFKQVTSHILFLLILVELFRLMMNYLQQHSVSVGVAVEVTIVSVLREIIVKGVLEISWLQLLATCGLLLILRTLLDKPPQPKISQSSLHYHEDYVKERINTDI